MLHPVPPASCRPARVTRAYSPCAFFLPSDLGMRTLTLMRPLFFQTKNNRTRAASPCYASAPGPDMREPFFSPPVAPSSFVILAIIFLLTRYCQLAIMRLSVCQFAAPARCPALPFPLQHRAAGSSRNPFPLRTCSIAPLTPLPFALPHPRAFFGRWPSSGPNRQPFLLGTHPPFTSHQSQVTSHASVR